MVILAFDGLFLGCNVPNTELLAAFLKIVELVQDEEKDDEQEDIGGLESIVASFQSMNDDTKKDILDSLDKDAQIHLLQLVEEHTNPMASAVAKLAPQPLHR